MGVESGGQDSPGRGSQGHNGGSAVSKHGAEPESPHDGGSGQHVEGVVAEMLNGDSRQSAWRAADQPVAE
jgi:hypothetical protein